MGISCDAILFFGFPFGEEDDPILGGDEDGESWESKLYALSGVKMPEESYDEKDAKLKERYHAAWDAQRAVLKKEVCEIDTHATGDYPMPFVCIKATKTTAYLGDPKKIETPKTDPKEWIEALRTFCDKLGIEWQEPAWYLVSYYSH